ncbi:hypothetical protein BN11_4460002 [Nostocoides australiense Ben110]|uniref:Uncharacterized protein n=1 Tax=Nostocoides australiense Ben110 TaxID=1193182 RepID=W6K460_9MICO|nr:hypothetical protein BN11_4460002 [Tetrasphaera australiensis Ben110]
MQLMSYRNAAEADVLVRIICHSL